MTTEAEIKAVSKAQDRRQPPDAGGGRKGPPETLRGSGALPAPGPQNPGIRNRELMPFRCLKPPSVGSFVWSAPGSSEGHPLGGTVYVTWERGARERAGAAAPLSLPWSRVEALCPVGCGECPGGRGARRTARPAQQTAVSGDRLGRGGQAGPARQLLGLRPTPFAGAGKANDLRTE